VVGLDGGTRPPSLNEEKKINGGGGGEPPLNGVSKMQATIFYLNLSDEDTDVINGPEGGWGCPIGKSYMSAKMDGVVDARAGQMYGRAAVVNVKNAETAWMALQNVTDSWADRLDDERILVRLDERRSMDVGDVVSWDDGRCERVCVMGFEGCDHPWNKRTD